MVFGWLAGSGAAVIPILRRVNGRPDLAMHVFGQCTQSTLNVGPPCQKKRSRRRNRNQVEYQEVKKGRRSSGRPSGREGCCQHPALEAAATKAADFRRQARAAAAESKGAAEQRRSDADAARQEVAKLEPLQRKAKRDAAKSAAAVKEANTGPQSSTRLLKRPGERPRAAKPQPSEQGLPPRRWRLLQTKAADFAAKHEAAAAEVKRRRGAHGLTQIVNSGGDEASRRACSAAPFDSLSAASCLAAKSAAFVATASSAAAASLARSAAASRPVAFACLFSKRVELCGPVVCL